MATNKAVEALGPLTLAMPVGVNLASGQPVLFGKGTHAVPGVLTEAQNTALPPYDANNGYLTFDPIGGAFLTVVAETLGSVSAGSAINVGDPIFASGGTYDKTTGITYGFVLCTDANGDFFGLAMQPIAAGLTATIPVLMKNAC